VDTTTVKVHRESMAGSASTERTTITMVNLTARTLTARSMADAVVREVMRQVECVSITKIMIMMGKPIAMTRTARKILVLDGTAGELKRVDNALMV